MRHTLLNKKKPVEEKALHGRSSYLVLLVNDR